MIKKTKTIYGDIDTIKKHGFQEYLDNFDWPISESEYQNNVVLMHKTYIDILNNSKDSLIYDIGLVELALITEIQIIYHYQAVKKNALHNNYVLEYSEKSRKYYDPHWEEYANYYSSMKFPHGPVMRRIRRIIKLFLFNRHLPIISFVKGLFLRNIVIGVGSFDRLKQEYIVKNELFCDHLDWPDILNSRLIDSKEVDRVFIKFDKEIVTPFLDFLRCLDSDVFTKNLISNLRLTWSQRLKDLIILFNSCNIFDGKNILITEVGKPHSKIISLVNNRYGVKVYNFHHGSDMGEVVQTRSHINDTSHCRYFVVPTNSSKRAYEENYRNLSVENRTGLTYISNNSNFYTNLYSNNQNLAPSSKIKNVMIIGYPMTQYRPMEEVGFFFYIRLQFEFRLILALKNKGFRVLYKAHPDRLDEISGFFEKIVDEFLVDPFEKVWNQADALVYGLTSTSTFGYGLCTNLPITLINLDGTLWNPKQKKYLKERVSFVSAKLNKKQQIDFSEEELFNSLKIPKPAKNWKAVDQYFN
jgi:hypothetical protein